MKDDDDEECMPKEPLDQTHVIRDSRHRIQLHSFVCNLKSKIERDKIGHVSKNVYAQSWIRHFELEMHLNDGKMRTKSICKETQRCQL